jgi:hypothetical protein
VDVNRLFIFKNINMNKIKVGDYIAGFDAEASRQWREVIKRGLSRDLNTLKGLVTHVGGPNVLDNCYFIELTSLEGAKIKMNFRPLLGCSMRLPYEFTLLGRLDEFKKEFIKRHKTPEFSWIEGVDLNYVRTEAGLFTLNALKKGITTPMPPQVESKLPRVFWEEAPLPLVRI